MVAAREEDRPKVSPLGERIFMMGEVLYLLTHSPFHRGYNVLDIVNYFMTPTSLGQFRIYRSKDRPVGFVVWGYFSQQVSEWYATGNYEIDHSAWKSGKELWFVEFVAPFGHARQMIEDMRQDSFADAHARFLRRSRGRPRVVDIYGHRHPAALRSAPTASPEARAT